MSEAMDDILHTSLDEVDRARRRQWAYLALCFCCLAVFDSNCDRVVVKTMIVGGRLLIAFALIRLESTESVTALSRRPFTKPRTSGDI